MACAECSSARRLAGGQSSAVSPRRVTCAHSLGRRARSLPRSEIVVARAGALAANPPLSTCAGRQNASIGRAEEQRATRANASTRRRSSCSFRFRALAVDRPMYKAGWARMYSRSGQIYKSEPREPAPAQRHQSLPSSKPSLSTRFRGPSSSEQSIGLAFFSFLAGTGGFATTALMLLCSGTETRARPGRRAPAA